jgi:integrase/recombinase XerD
MIHGKGGKLGYVPAFAGTLGLIVDYLEAAGHGADHDGALFRPIQNNVILKLSVAVTAHAVYRGRREALSSENRP